MRVRRKLAGIQDAIDALDETLRRAKGDPILAMSKLSANELSFVREELTSCITSRVYYLENYHVIQNEVGVLMGMHPIWQLQWMIEEAIQRERDLTGQCRIIVLKPRQSGGTEFVTGVMCHCTFFTPQAYTMCVAQDVITAGWVQRKVVTAWHHLPWWLRPERQYATKGEYLEFQRKDDYQRHQNPGLGSVFVTTHAERGAGIAIGKTVRFLHGTEVSRWNSGSIYTADIEPSMNAPDTLAVMESASLNDSGFFKNLYEGAVADPDSGWVPVFLPAYRAKKFSLPIKLNVKFALTDVEHAIRERVWHEENFTIPLEFFNWRRVKVKASIRDTGAPYDAYAAYPMTAKEAFQSSAQGAFPRHKLDEQEQRWVRNPAFAGEILFKGLNVPPKPVLESILPGQQLLRRGDIGTSRLWVWEEPDPREHYYIGADTGEGNGGNFSAAPVWRAGRGSLPDEQVAEWQGWITPTDWAKTLYALGWWYNKAEIAVEYMAGGITTGNFLLKDLEYPNLYRPRYQDRIKLTLAPFMHWFTNMKTKPGLVTHMQEALLSNLVVIRSQTLLDEMRKFRITSISSQGHVSYGGGSDSPDDLCMSAMIGLFCLYETMPELRGGFADDPTAGKPVRGARGGGIIYGIFDEWTRMRGQERDRQKAEGVIRDRPGWQIRPIPVMKANTAYSLIHHGRGAENDMLRAGVDSKEILPAAIHAWKGARAEEASDADEINSWAEGGERGGWQTVE